MAHICKKMQLGKLNKRVAIQAVTQTTDSAGGYTDSWATSATVWASIDPVSGRERFIYGQVTEPVTHRILMRYNSAVTVTGKKRLLYGSRTFNIVQVRNLEEADVWLEILAIENVPS